MAHMKPVVVGNSDSDQTNPTRKFRYGELQLAPSSLNLWAVSFSLYGKENRETVHYTFAVHRKFANRPTFEMFGYDVNSWMQVAEAHWIGPWCEVYECLWEEVPIHKHYLPNGTPLYYGLSCTLEPLSTLGKYLSYVAIGTVKVSWFNELRYHHVFLVDKECCTPEFMNKMGADPKRWQLVCWQHPADGQDPRVHDWFVEPQHRPDINHVFKMDEATRKRRRAKMLNPLNYLFGLLELFRRQPTK